MTQIIPGESEGVESVLRRFKREVSKAGIFQDMKKHRHFETPIEKKKRKEIAKHKQSRKRFRFWRLCVGTVQLCHVTDGLERLALMG